MPTRINLKHLDQSGATPGQAIIWNGTKWGSAPVVSTDSVNVKSHGAIGDGVADDTTSIQNAIAASSGIVFFPTGNYKITEITVPTNITLRGEGIESSVLTTNTTGNAVTVGGHNVTIEYIGIAQQSPLRGNGLVSSERYWLTTTHLSITGFINNIYADRAIYHSHRRLLSDNSTNGVNYWGISGVWNTDWYNNVITFDNCRFTHSTTTGCSLKATEVVFTAPDFSGTGPTSGAIGCKIYGDDASEIAHGIKIISPYCEFTKIPYSFTHAHVEIDSGFALGGSDLSGSCTSIIQADDSFVRISKMTDWGYWNFGYNLVNNSTLSFGRTFANSIRASVGTVDETSRVAEDNIFSDLSIYKNSGLRWKMALSNTESGGNTGSDLDIQAYDDDGVLIDAPMTIGRGAGSYIAYWRNEVYFGSPSLSASVNMYCRGAAGYARGFTILSGLDRRWAFAANAQPESSANVGSDLQINAYQDNGDADSVIYCERVAGGAYQMRRPSVWTGFAGSSQHQTHRIVASDGYQKILEFGTGWYPRWRLVSNGTAETGGDIGSDFALESYDDSTYTLIDRPLTVPRKANGIAAWARPLSITSTISANTPAANEVIISDGTIKLARTSDAGLDEVVRGNDTRVLYNPINVKTYGAVGDGVTDDTAAIQSAINVANGERAVLIPAGTYFIVGTLTLAISGTTLVGEGMGITKLLGSGYDSVSSPVINISGNDCSISDMEATVEYGRHCVFVSGASRSNITRVYFSAGSRIGVFVHKNSQQTSISDSKFFGTAWAAIGTGGDPSGNVDGAVVGVSITRNLFYQTGAEAIDINWDTHSVLISQNQFLECSQASDEIIDIGGGTPPNHCSDISIIANTFYNTSIAGRAIWCKNASGLGTDYTERVLIAENTFYAPVSTGVEPYCIYATSSKNISIVNNIIQGYGRSIVLQQDATYVKVSGNTIKTAYGHLLGFLGTGIGRIEVENNLFFQEGGSETAVRLSYGIFVKFSGNKFIGRVGLDCIQIGSGLQGPTLITNNQFVGGEKQIKLEVNAKNVSLYANQFSRAEKNCVWSLGGNTNIQIVNNDFHEWSSSSGTWPAINISGGNGVSISNNAFYNDISAVGDDAIQLSGVITGGMIIGNRFGNSLTGSTIVNKSNLMYGNISCNYDIKSLTSLTETGFVIEDSTSAPTPSANQVSISNGTIRIGRTTDAGPDEVVRGDDSRLGGLSSSENYFTSSFIPLTASISAVSIETVYTGNKTLLNLSTLDGGSFTLSTSSSFYNPLLPGYTLIPNRDATVLAGSQYCVDLQTYREVTTQMCGGIYNSILGGLNNTIKSEAQKCAILGGESNMISGSGVVYSYVSGRNNVCTHQHTTMSGIYGKSFAGRSNVVAANTGGAYGGVQSERYGAASAETFGAGVVSFSLDGITSQIDISPNSVIHGVAKICAMSYSPSSNTDAAGYDIEFTAKRGSTGNVSFVGIPVIRSQESDALWDCGMKLQTTSVQITAATFTAGINVKWGAIIDVVRTNIGY